jgi:hypothetical protein
MSETSDGAGPPPVTDNNNNNNRRSRRNNGGNRNPRNRTTAYQGKIDDLKSFVYDVSAIGSGGMDSFHGTTKEIGEYIARTYKGGGEFIQAFNPSNLGFTPINNPTTPGANATLEEIEIWKLMFKSQHVKRETRDELKKQAYAVVLGQCSQAIRDRLEASNTWEAINTSSDVISLLELIRSCLFSGATTRHEVHALQDAEDNFLGLKQTTNMSNADYLDKFKTYLQIYEYLGGEVGGSEANIARYIDATDPDNPTADEMSLATATAKSEYLAVRFLRRSDQRRYGVLMAEVENGYTRGLDSYPTTLPVAYDMLVNYVNPTLVQHDRQSGLSFIVR